MNDGEKIRKIRIRKEFSQEYIALKIGKSQKTISDLEHYETIKEEKILEICKALEITKDYFDNYVDEMVFESKHKEVDSSIISYFLKIVVEQNELIKKLLNLPPPHLRISLAFKKKIGIINGPQP
jgi:transcriptional regulator with XRE-family HTH domain